MFQLIAGPCAIENRDTPFEVAESLKRICAERSIPFIFKGSFKKANRSRLDSFTGIGDEKALQILSDVKEQLGLKVTTDIHTEQEANIAAKVVDILQIPAFLCRQTDLLVAAAKTGKLVNVKKGQFMSPQSMQFAVNKVLESGGKEVWLTERGTTFGYTDLVVDYRGIPIMKSMNVPVIMDCTHALQQPNQTIGVTGGLPQLIETIAKAAIACGVDGLFIETHPDPANALSDGANMLPLDKMEALLDRLIPIFNAVQ